METVTEVEDHDHGHPVQDPPSGFSCKKVLQHGPTSLLRASTPQEMAERVHRGYPHGVHQPPARIQKSKQSRNRHDSPLSQFAVSIRQAYFTVIARSPSQTPWMLQRAKARSVPLWVSTMLKVTLGLTFPGVKSARARNSRSS